MVLLNGTIVCPIVRGREISKTLTHMARKVMLKVGMSRKTFFITSSKKSKLHQCLRKLFDNYVQRIQLKKMIQKERHGKLIPLLSNRTTRSQYLIFLQITNASTCAPTCPISRIFLKLVGGNSIDVNFISKSRVKTLFSILAAFSCGKSQPWNKMDRGATTID